VGQKRISQATYSDVFQVHGTRINPGGGSSRVYYDFGQVNQGSVTVSFQLLDDVWFFRYQHLERYI
jgi:hypothetical protein